VGSVGCGAWSVKCGVGSVERVKCGVQSVKRKKSQCYFVLQRLHKTLPSTIYFVRQSLQKALPSTTLYYKACTKSFQVLLCSTTKLARNTSQYYFVPLPSSSKLHRLHVIRPHRCKPSMVRRRQKPQLFSPVFPPWELHRLHVIRLHRCKPSTVGSKNHSYFHPFFPLGSPTGYMSSGFTVANHLH